MVHRLVGLLMAAAMLTGCSLLPRVPESNQPAGPGYATPTPGARVDIETVTGAVAELQAAAGGTEFWELTAWDHGRVDLVAAGPDGPVAHEWRDGQITSETGSRVQGVVPLDLAQVDLDQILAAAQEIHADFYTCHTTVESVGYQGQVTIFCDDAIEAFWTMDLQPMGADFSSEQAMAATFALMGSGAPDQVNRFEVRGPTDPRLTVGFADSGEDVRSDIMLNDFRGMSTSTNLGGDAVDYSRLDAAHLYPCALQMMDASGLPGWHAWMSVADDGSIRLLWDIHGMWDPEGEISVTNERCEVVES